MAAANRKADGVGETVFPVTREFNRSTREWLNSLRTDEAPEAKCDACGTTEGRMVYTGHPNPVCEACAAYSHGYDHGEAGVVAELMVMAWRPSSGTATASRRTASRSGRSSRASGSRSTGSAADGPQGNRPSHRARVRERHHLCPALPCVR